MLTQRGWRIVGGVALAVSGVMAIGGVRLDLLRSSKTAFVVYWLIFSVSLLVSVYCAFLDLRYIRVQQAIAERELFRETLGEESFRKSLRSGPQPAGKNDAVPPSGS